MEGIRNLVLVLSLTMCALAGALANNVSDVHIVCRKITVPLDIDGKFDEPCYAHAEWSAPFSILTKENKDINGLFEQVDDKFIRCASTSAMFYDDDAFYVAIHSPYPEDVKPVSRNAEVYLDDCVEFFIQTNAKTFFQVITSFQGRQQCLEYDAISRVGKEWKPKGLKTAAKLGKNAFDVEMRIPYADLGTDRPSEGQMWRGNFTREGVSCGNLSTWAPVGPNFSSPEGFGKFVMGSRAKYLENILNELETMIPAKASAQQKEDFSNLCKNIRNEIQRDGNQPQNWTGLNKKLQAMRNTLLKMANSEKTSLVWACDRWKDFQPDVKIPFDVQELDVLQISGPQGAYNGNAVLVSNLTDRMAMFNVYFNTLRGKEDVIKNSLRFRQVEHIELNGGYLMPDVLFDLPMGSIIRIMPNSTSMIWVDVNAKLLEPGEIPVNVILKSSYKAMEDKRFQLKIRTSSVDIREISFPVWTYPLRWPENIRALHEYDFNTSSLIPSQFAPNPQPDGTYNFASFDREVQALKDNGIEEKDMFFLLYAEWPRWSEITIGGKKVGFMQEGWAEEYGRRLCAFRDYVKEKYGIGYSQFAVYTNDEPNGNPADPEQSAYFAFEGAKFLRSVDPKIQIFCNPWRNEPEYVQMYLDTFDILEPCLPRLRPQKEVLKKYQESGKYICSYSVLEKSNPPFVYRLMSWQHMKYGFEGWASFYDLYDASGDPFYSYDAKPNTKIIADYQTYYRNQSRTMGAPSRRLIAWYDGVVEFKLEKLCRKRIADAEAKNQNMTAAEEKLDAIIEAANQPDANFDECREQLIKLAELLE